MKTDIESKKDEKKLEKSWSREQNSHNLKLTRKSQELFSLHLGNRKKAMKNSIRKYYKRSMKDGKKIEERKWNMDDVL